VQQRRISFTQTGDCVQRWNGQELNESEMTRTRGSSTLVKETSSQLGRFPHADGRILQCMLARRTI
jgi:hypothetical protein